MSALPEPVAAPWDRPRREAPRGTALRTATHLLRLLGAIGLVAAALAAGWQAERLRQRDTAVDGMYAAQRDAAGRIGRQVALAGGETDLSRIDDLRLGARAALATDDLPEAPYDRWTGSFALDGDLARIRERWSIFDEAFARWSEGRERVLGLRADVERFQSIATGILVTSDELVEVMVARDAPARTIRLASRQLMLIQRITTNVRRLLEPGDGVVAAADRFGRDAVLFGQSNNALLHGSREARIERVEDPESRQALEQLGREFRAASEVIERLLSSAGAVASSGRVSREVHTALDTLIATIDAARRHYRERAAARPDFRDAGLAMALAAVLLVLLAATGVVVDARRARAARERREAEVGGWLDAWEQRESQFAEDGARLQSHCEALASAVEALGEGRLDAGLSAGEPPLDVLVEALAAAGAALGTRIEGLRSMAGEAARALDLARDSGARLRAGLERQVADLPAAADVCTDLAQGAAALEAGSRELGGLTDGAAATLNAVTVASREALPQVEAAAGALRETASYVQRLVDATAQVRELSAVVDELGDQSKMLSLNIAIQASMDTPAGRALANFADDVQRLAERARQANRRIGSANDALRKAAEDAADAVKRGQWSGGTAAKGLRGVADQLEAAGALAERLRVLDGSLAAVTRTQVERTAAARETVEALRDFMAQAKDGAYGNADSVARLGEVLRRIDAGLGEFDVVEPATREVVALAAQRDAEPDAGAADAERAAPRW